MTGLDVTLVIVSIERLSSSRVFVFEASAIHAIIMNLCSKSFRYFPGPVKGF